MSGRRTKKEISYNMSRIRSKGSKMERTFGKALWAAGVRYRKHYAVEGKPDFALPGLKIAIFCDSSFWHGRDWGPKKKKEFKVRREFWIKKIERNIQRDKEVNDELRAAGWRVLRFWDTDIKKNINDCVSRVLQAIEEGKSWRNKTALEAVSKKNNNSTKREKVLAVDLFCGGGGATVGFMDAGIQVVAGVDNDELARKTYEEGNKPAKFICRDIADESKMILSELTEVLFEYGWSKQGESRPKLVLIACPPCQPYTHLANELSQSTKKQRAKDRNLFSATLEYVAFLKPDAIFYENVTGVTKGSNKEILKSFQRSLRTRGYLVACGCIDAQFFGVPQRRRRYILMALKKSYVGADVEFVLPQKGNSDRILKVRDVLKLNGKLRYPTLKHGSQHPKIPNHICSRLEPQNLARISRLKPGQYNDKLGRLRAECHRRLASGRNQDPYSDVYTRMSWDRPAPSITTKCNSITNGRFGHPDVRQNRAISIREAAALQTFKDDYLFYPLNELITPARLIGNSVPPKLAEYFADYLLKFFS